MKRLLTKCALLLALCAALALPALADSVTDTISVCIGYFGWTEDEYVEKAKFSWQELDDWYGGALDTHEEFYSYSNGGGRTYLVYARGFYIRDLLDYAGVDVNSIASIDFFTKDHSNGAYRSFTKYALLDQPRYYFPNLAADPETGELYAWDGGDDLWVGAYQVEPMLALEDYTEWDTSGFDFESYVDESLFSTGNRFHLFFGQQSPEEAATSSAAKYVYKILVTFSGTPVLSSEEHNLDLIVGSDHALHVTADAEDDALTDYVQQNLQYVSSDPSVVSVDQYGRLHVNAEGDAVITASFGQSSVSTSVHVGSGGASGTGSTSGTGTEPGGEAASGTLDLPKPEEAEAVPVTEPVDARSVYILSGGAVSTGENGTTAGEGMQDGSVQLVLPEKAAQKTWPVYAALALSVLPFEARAASDAWDGTVDISWYDPAKTEYEIDTPAKLAGLAALVNGMADPTAKKIVGNTAYLVSKKVDNVMLVGVSGERSEAEFETGWQPAVRNLVLGSGWIYARRMVGGIVGRVGETSNGVIIENCGNRADIKNTDSKGVGGTTEADFTSESATGKRMPSGVMALIVVSAAKAEEKPAEETKTGFTDVLDTDWFKADVEKAVESKLMTGTSATTFSPKGVTTRAMVVATLYRLAGSPEVTEKAAFTDVASGSYYEAAVAWAAKNEIASGTSATTFEPNKAVTREQLAKFLFNYAVYQGMDAVTLSENLSSFADHDTVSGYAVPAMQWAVGQGFINGTDGKLLPTGTATRCQFAAILNRFTAAQSAKA